MKSTVLNDEHVKLSAKLVPFGGWQMPVQYTGIIAEHNWTRSFCSVFDICHMGEFLIYADPKTTNLERLFTFNITDIPIKTCRYGFMLNEQAGIIDDVIIYRINPEKWMLVVNAATTESDEKHLRANLSKNAKLENISSRTGKLDLQGPRSLEVLTAIVGNKIEKLGYYTFDNFSLFGEENIISRTGYTGELGYELYISSEKTKDLWKLLLKDKKVKPAGLGARDTLRLEMGYPLYGQDIDLNADPFEAGMSKFIDIDKDFIGREMLLEKKKQGVRKKLSFFITQSRRAPRHNYAVYGENNKQIGIITSGTFSPTLSCGIAMGYIEKEYDSSGAEVLLKDNQVEIKAQITQKPFYKQGTVRAKL